MSLRRLDSGGFANAFGNHARYLVVVGDFDKGDEVNVSCDRIGSTNTIDVGDRLSGFVDGFWCHVYETKGGDHVP